MTAPSLLPPPLETDRSAGPDERARGGRLAGTLGLAVLAVAAATAAATAAEVLAAGAPLFLMAPLILLVGAGLVALAVSNVEVFLLVVLVSRASLDALKIPGGSPAGVDAAGALALLLTLVASLWLLAHRNETRGTRWLSGLDRALLAFLAAAGVGVLVSSTPAESLVEFVRMLSMAPVLLLVERLAARPGGTRRALVAVFASLPVPLAYAAYQVATGSGVFSAGGFERVRGTFTHPNVLAAYLVFLVVTGVAVLPHLRRRRYRLLLGALLVLSALALMSTYTRGAWIATVAGLVVVGLLQDRRILVGIVSATLAVVLFVPSVSARFADLGESTQLNGTSGNSLSWRVGYWADALELAEESPVLGVGLKAVATRLDEGKQPHNDVVRAYVELGVLGLATYLALLVALALTARAALRATAAAARARTRDLDRGVAVAAAGCVTAFAVMSVVANVFSQLVILWYFLTVVGLAVAVSRRGDTVDVVALAPEDR